MQVHFTWPITSSYTYHVTNLHEDFANDHVIVVSEDGAEDRRDSVFLRFNVSALRTKFVTIRTTDKLQ